MNIGWQEILLILLVALLLFGAKRIPDLAKGLGKGIRARLEIVYLSKGGSWVQIPPSPFPHLKNVGC